MSPERRSGIVFETRIDLPRDHREALVALLNRVLANGMDLYAQTKQAHWNVKGTDFYQLHLLFDDLAEMVQPHVDLVAERVTALGGVARGTLRMAAQASDLDEFPTEPQTGRAYVEALAIRFAAHASVVRGGIDEAEEQGDMGTADLLTGMVRDLDKALYFLESHLQRREP